MPGLSDATRGRLLFGADCNPEQWPEETWHEDVRLMKAAGVNSVTLGVFPWSTPEPEPGAREFGRLDTLMDLMHANGIGVVLATPASSPPPRMGRLHPDTLPVTEDGRTGWWGGRQHFSHSSATYRRSAAAITEDAGVRPVLDGLPEQVDAVRRGEVLFVLNHSLDPVTVEVPGTHHDLLTGTAVTDRVTLGRYGAAVLRS
ncbi:beta-galactosidase [Streptomyces lateritius]|uniref:Beta-galactosidase n=1 Tax=Streptomyces lateritius TaxID=67313 RepID=A0ABW6YJR3_9ACTN